VQGTKNCRDSPSNGRFYNNFSHHIPNDDRNRVQPESNIEKIVERIFLTHRITRADQRIFMMTLLSKDSLSSKEQMLIDRVFEALRQGLLRVVD
jgi:hypothetical protein